MSGSLWEGFQARGVAKTQRRRKIQDVDRHRSDVCVDGSLCLGQDLVGKLYELVLFAAAGG